MMCSSRSEPRAVGTVGRYGAAAYDKPPARSSLGELFGEKRPYLVRIDVGRNEARADPARQDEGEPSALDLLVLGHEVEQAVDSGQGAGNLGDLGRQAGRGQVPAYAVRLRGRREAQSDREAERQGHADRDRFAVQEAIGEARRGLERMPEGVAEI